MIEEDVKTVVQLLENKRKVCALLAPTVEKTLGDPVQKEMFYKALSDAGFFTWRQIAEEADQLASQEVEEWESRTEDKKIIISSSCPAIVRLVEKEYPELSVYLSSTKSPMHLASFKVKEENANVKTVFIGPCYWKKKEQKRQLNEKGHVDVVLTFEEFIEVLKNLKMDYGRQRNHSWRKHRHAWANGVLRSGKNEEIKSKSDAPIFNRSRNR